jgi:serine/threonine protein kinase
MGIMHRNIKPDSLVPYIESRSHNESYSSSSINSESNSSSSYSKSSKTDNNNHDSNKFSNIKLIDLSLSKFININEKIKEPYGTVGYTSPEMLLEQSYDFKIDEWSIGILTYLLLCGKLPFSDEHSEREVARQTIHEKLSFTQPIWEKKSIEAKDFVNRLLNKDPKKRMSVKEALVHPWIQNHFPSAVEERLKKNYNHEGEIIEFEKFSSFINNK